MAAELCRLESQLEQLRDSYAALGKAYAEALHAQGSAERRYAELEARLRALATSYGACEQSALARAEAPSAAGVASAYAPVAAEILACLDGVDVAERRR
jgi:chromosome segregation ATPase